MAKKRILSDGEHYKRYVQNEIISFVYTRAKHRFILTQKNCLF